MPADPAADACVLCLPERTSLGDWRRRGRLDQQAPFLRRLAGGRMGLVLVADPSTSPVPAIEGVRVVERAEGVDVGQATLDALGAVAGARVVVRTYQLDDAGSSARIAAALRARGAWAGRIARGGHLRSRFLARQLGADAPETRRAGLVERELCVTSDLLVGTTGIMVDDLAWRWGLPDARTRVIPNFVDDEQPVGDPDQREPGRVLVVGALERHKNVDVVVRAIGALPRGARGGITLDVVGDGPLLDTLRTLAEELGVRAEFSRALAHAEVLDRMRRCAVYVHASAYEGHPRALIEAMAAGAPCIVANTPGLGIVIDNGVSGILVPGTTDSITYALSGALEDDGWREMLGRAAATAARRRYGLSHVWELDVDAHRAALDIGAGRARRAG